MADIWGSNKPAQQEQANPMAAGVPSTQETALTERQIRTKLKQIGRTINRNDVKGKDKVELLDLAERYEALLIIAVRDTMARGKAPITPVLSGNASK